MKKILLITLLLFSTIFVAFPYSNSLVSLTPLPTSKWDELPFIDVKAKKNVKYKNIKELETALKELSNTIETSLSSIRKEIEGKKYCEKDSLETCFYKVLSKRKKPLISEASLLKISKILNEGETPFKLSTTYSETVGEFLKAVDQLLTAELEALKLNPSNEILEEEVKRVYTLSVQTLKPYITYIEADNSLTPKELKDLEDITLKIFNLSFKIATAYPKLRGFLNEKSDLLFTATDTALVFEPIAKWLWVSWIIENPIKSENDEDNILKAGVLLANLKNIEELYSNDLPYQEKLRSLRNFFRTLETLKKNPKLDPKVRAVLDYLYNSAKDLPELYQDALILMNLSDIYSLYLTGDLNSCKAINFYTTSGFKVEEKDGTCIYSFKNSQITLKIK